jgi:hypothetical protein
LPPTRLLATDSRLTYICCSLRIVIQPVECKRANDAASVTELSSQSIFGLMLRKLIDVEK